MHRAPVETGEECSGNQGFPQMLEELKVFVGLFNGSCHMHCPLEVITEHDPQGILFCIGHSVVICHDIGVMTLVHNNIGEYTPLGSGLWIEITLKRKYIF